MLHLTLLRCEPETSIDLKFAFFFTGGEGVWLNISDGNVYM